MRRRKFITLLGSVSIARPQVVAAGRAIGATVATSAASVLATSPAKSKTDRVVRIGLLLNSHLAEGVEAFVAELRRLGYQEGQNLALDWRFVETAERNKALATELVAGNPDVLVGAGTQQVAALQGAAGSIPIVFTNTADPVGQRLVASLARPGGNITGIANYVPELAAKRLELIGEVTPRGHPIAMLFNPANPLSVETLRETEAAALARGMTLVPASARSPEELPSTLQRIAENNAAGLIGASDIMISAHTKSIIAFAAQLRLPTMFPYLQDARAGGLMSYGIDPTESYRRAAQLVDKILKGTKPSDLPVEQPSKFKLVVNLKTARALGLTVLPSILARADEVIE